jgi:hypothetical protein
MAVSDHAAAGGKARSQKLSPERRREIAIVAALKRWSKREKTEAQPEPATDSAQQPEPTKAAQSAYPPPAEQYAPVMLTADRQRRINKEDQRRYGRSGSGWSVF